MKPGPRPWTGDAGSYLATTAQLLAQVEPQVRAFTHLDSAVLSQPDIGGRGPLRGMPVAVKEIIDVAGLPTTHGSAVHAGRVPRHDADAVARLRAAGAQVLGMTTTTPFACGTTTATDNPRAPGHTPGGSSAGSGAAVGAGFVPVALASQSQASTLRPASYCGAWGFKPSHGRLPTTGMHLLAPILDDLGIIAASLADLTAAFSVLAMPRPVAVPDPGDALRIGRVRLDDGGLPEPATTAALDQLVARLQTRWNIEADRAELRAIDAELTGSGTTCFGLFASQSATALAGYVAAGERDPRLAEMVAHADHLDDRDVAELLVTRDRLRARWSELAEHHDVLISLATTGPAPAGHASTGCRRMPATSSLLGVPALSAPWMTVGGLPVGVQLLGFAGRDEELLAAASAIDAALTSTEEEP